MISTDTVTQMQRRDIDAFGTEQTAEGPPYCRVLVTATKECQRNLIYRVPIDGVTSDVKTVLIHCTQEQAQGEYDCDCVLTVKIVQFQVFILNSIKLIIILAT